jgi:hypothetical protein
MPKKNTWLARQQAAAEVRAAARAEIQRRFALQQAQDMAVIALNQAFGFGPERTKKFVEAFNGVFEMYADMAIEDAKDDADIEYTRVKLDEVLKEACGESFIPWDERYAWVYQLDKRRQPGGGQ